MSLPSPEEHRIFSSTLTSSYRKEAASMLTHMAIPLKTNDENKAIYFYEAWVRDMNMEEKYRGTSIMVRYSDGEETVKEDDMPFHTSRLEQYKQMLKKHEDNPFRSKTYIRLIDLAEIGLNFICIKR
jgi:hypothetical protein